LQSCGGNQSDDGGTGEHSFHGGARTAVGDFLLDCSGNRIGVNGDDGNAILKIVIEQVCAEFEIEEIGSDASHREEQDYRNDGYEKIRGDQAITQPPQQIGANPGQRADKKIKCTNKTEKAKKGREREQTAGQLNNFENSIEENDGQRKAVHRGGPSKEDRESTRGKSVHGHPVCGAREIICDGNGRRKLTVARWLGRPYRKRRLKREAELWWTDEAARRCTTAAASERIVDRYFEERLAICTRL
jgi:hypothetical protein